MSAQVDRAHLPPRAQSFWTWEVAQVVLLGLLGLLGSQLKVPLLSEDSPVFTFGQAFVLVAFVRYGGRAGLLAGLIAFSTDLLRGDAIGLATMGYVLEAATVAWLAQRVRGVMPAVLCYWLAMGWAVDIAIYGGLLRLPFDYVLLVYVKQLLNETLSGLIAVAALWVLARWDEVRVKPEREIEHPIPVSALIFRLVVTVLAGPLVLLGIQRARDAFASERILLHRDALRAAHVVASRLTTISDAVSRPIQDLSRVPVSPDTAYFKQRMRSTHREHPEFVNISVSDRDGWTFLSSPDTTALGKPLPGTSIVRRPYFAEARNRGRIVQSPLILGTRGVRKATGLEPILVYAAPRYAEDGAFDGVVLGAVDQTEIQNLLDGMERADGDVTVLDRTGHVIASHLRELSPGDSLPKSAPRLAEQDTPLDFSWYPPSDGSRLARRRLNLRFASFLPVSAGDYSVIVDQPGSVLWRRMRGALLELIALFVAIAGLTLVAAEAIARWSRSRMQSLSRVTSDLAERRFDAAAGSLRAFDGSHTQEVRQVAGHLEVLRRDLQEYVSRQEQRTSQLEHHLIQAQKLEATGQLAGGIAHDFNNLLTPILGLASLSRLSVPEDSPLATDLEQIERSAERARDLTRQLLAFSRRQPMSVASVPSREMLESLMPMLRAAVKANVELSLTIDGEPPPIRGDRGMLEQVMTNLVLNAAAASSTSIVVGARGVEFRGEPHGLNGRMLEGRGVVLEVRDNGQGISPENLDRIFEPFFTTNERAGGSGLGLAMVYGIVQQHEGDVDVESTVGVGSRFQVFLPAASAAVDEPASPPEPPTGADPWSGTILLVDDEPSVRDVARRYLERSGHQVLSAESPRAALALAEDPTVAFDVLLTDVVMPELTGPELVQRVRALRPQVTVVFMTGYSRDLLAPDHPEAESPEVVTKPFTAAELLEAIARAHGDHRARESRTSRTPVSDPPTA